MRVSGSGMGCPDWPKCFGKLIPPTKLSQLPTDYKVIFASPGKPVADFNAFHTWTEYINRLIGALTGLFIAITMLSSFQYYKTKKHIFFLALAAFVLVLFQAWIGAKVVDTHLAGWMVSVHLVLALIVVILVMVAVFNLEKVQKVKRVFSVDKLLQTNALLFAFTFIQIVWGSQVREKVTLAISQGYLDNWVKELATILSGHVFLSFLVLFLNIYLWQKVSSSFEKDSPCRRVIFVSLLMLLAQIATGFLNISLNFPAIAQVIHIFAGSVAFGCQWFSLILFWNSRQIRFNSVNITVSR